MCISAREALGWWTPDPVAIGTVVLTSAVYARGLRALWRDGRYGRGIRPAEAIAFFAGQLVLVLSLVSPIDRLSDILFSAHMTQHEIIMLVAPLLVVLGRPWIALLWALPRDARDRVRPLARSRPFRAATTPLVALALHAVVVWVWHVPLLFEGAMRSEPVHAVQHATFFLTAALFWATILRGRYGRAGYGLAAAFVFATAMHTNVLGALVALASRLWYPIYAARGAPFGVDAGEDQALAGAIMWVPANVVLTLVALGLFAAWLGEARRRGRKRELRTRTAR